VAIHCEDGRERKRHLIMLVVTLASLGRGQIIAEAQNATPPVGVEVAGAEACQVDPRSPDFILALAGTPMAGQATSSPTPFATPDGEAADAETVEGITATMQEVVACFNAADLLRAFALFSDDYFRRLIPEGPVGEVFTGFLTGAPAPVTRIGPHAILDVRVMGDGRVGALVTLVDPEAPTPEDADHRFVVFVMIGDRWLIDEVMEFPVSGTPTS
jgi:hypothetical protein